MYRVITQEMYFFHKSFLNLCGRCTPVKPPLGPSLPESPEMQWLTIKLSPLSILKQTPVK